MTNALRRLHSLVTAALLVSVLSGCAAYAIPEDVSQQVVDNERVELGTCLIETEDKTTTITCPREDHKNLLGIVFGIALIPILLTLLLRKRETIDGKKRRVIGYILVPIAIGAWFVWAIGPIQTIIEPGRITHRAGHVLGRMETPTTWTTEQFGSFRVAALGGFSIGRGGPSAMIVAEDSEGSLIDVIIVPADRSILREEAEKLDLLRELLDARFATNALEQAELEAQEAAAAEEAAKNKNKRRRRRRRRRKR